jgi:hypothetical protein
MNGATYYVCYKTEDMPRFKKYDFEDDIPAVRFNFSTMVEDSDYTRMKLQDVADRHIEEGMVIQMRDQWNNVIFETE